MTSRPPASLTLTLTLDPHPHPTCLTPSLHLSLNGLATPNSTPIPKQVLSLSLTGPLTLSRSSTCPFRMPYLLKIQNATFANDKMTHYIKGISDMCSG